jgi:hypothetical protein
MRYDTAACSKRSTAMAMAGMQEFNLGIAIVPADRACAPDSHDRRQLFFEMFVIFAARCGTVTSSKSRPTRVNTY